VKSRRKTTRVLGEHGKFQAVVLRDENCNSKSTMLSRKHGLSMLDLSTDVM